MRTYMDCTESIKIAVKTRYLGEQSGADKNRYAFAYTIEITNLGSEMVKLLNRRWLITDDNNKVEEVIGEGVVGQQPEIQPGQTFHYTSGAVIETKFGTMEGSYEMLKTDGCTFKAPIPPFLLGQPHMVH